MNFHEITESFNNKRIPLKKSDRSKRAGEFPYYGASGVIDSIDDYLFDGRYLLIAEDGANLLSRSTPIAFEANGRFWVNNHAHIIRTKQEIASLRYLRYFLNSIDLTPYISGSAQPKLNQKNLHKITLPLPPLNEQRRIVTKIEELTDRTRKAREALEDVPQLIEQFRRSVLAAAFRGDLTADWREQNHVKSLEWTEYKFQDLLAEPLANGKSVRTGNESGFPVLRLTCIKDGKIDLTERKQGLWSREQAKKFIVRDGDYLIVRGNGSLNLVGKGGLVSNGDDEVAYPDTLIRARPDRNKIDPLFLSLIWDSSMVRKQIENSARTTAGIHKINQKTLSQITLSLPQLEEQREITRRLVKIFQGMEPVAAQHLEATAEIHMLDRAILAKAFQGQLVPQDPTDEPASQLLQRIRSEREKLKPKEKPMKKQKHP